MLELSDFVLIGVILFGVGAIYTAILYVAVSIFVEKELLKMGGKLQTFKASLKNMSGSRPVKEGFDWYQLIDAGKLVVDMKKQGMSVKDIVGEFAALDKDEEGS